MVNGLHPRHIGLLESRGLRVLAAILSCSEALGIFPEPLGVVLVALLGKLAGGFRPIGLYHPVFRIWAKARRKVVDNWDCQNPVAGFAAGKGQSSIDVVYRHAVRSELAQAEDKKFCIALLDLHKCYESVRHSICAGMLVKQSIPWPYSGFPSGHIGADE